MIDLELGGKRAIVSGAGFRPERAGHGRATALLLAKAGAVVTCIDINKARLEAVQAEIESNGGRVYAVHADMTQPDEAQRAVELSVKAMGGLDICIDIIGGATWSDAIACTNQQWDWELRNNLTQVFYLYRAAAVQMISQGTGGSLTALASVDGIGPAAYHVGYGAAKAGLISLTKTLAEELGSHGIRVNAVAPGNVGSGNWDREGVPFGSDPVNPLSPPRAYDVANGVIFLSSALAARVTGHVLVVDGGALIRSPWGFTRESIEPWHWQDRRG